MLAAEAAAAAIEAGSEHTELADYDAAVRSSWIADELKALAVECGQVIEHHAFRFTRNSRWIVEVKNGVTRAAKLHALVGGGEEPTAPEAVIQRLATLAATRCHGDKSGEIRILLSKSITRPGTHARSACDLGASLKESDCRVVIDGVGHHGLHETDLIGDARGVWNKFTQPRAALTMLREIKHGRGDGKAVLARGHGGDALATPHTIRQVLVEHRLHLWFGIKQIHL